MVRQNVFFFSICVSRLMILSWLFLFSINFFFCCLPVLARSSQLRDNKNGAKEFNLLARLSRWNCIVTFCLRNEFMRWARRFIKRFRLFEWNFTKNCSRQRNMQAWTLRHEISWMRKFRKDFNYTKSRNNKTFSDDFHRAVSHNLY